LFQINSMYSMRVEQTSMSSQDEFKKLVPNDVPKRPKG